MVVAIPNGGIPVGAVIAETLGTELYLLLVRKLKIPDNPEAGFGAVANNGFVLLNENLVRRLRLTEREILRQKEEALKSIRAREAFFGALSKPPGMNGRKVVLVDDGLASGFTMEVAVRSAENQGAKEIIVAVPTSSMSAYQRLKPLVEDIICPDVSRSPVFAVANAYMHWYDLEEREALTLLQKVGKGGS
jgi:predicted phosphoribosyltransferase